MVNRRKASQLGKTVEEGQEKSSQAKKRKVLKHAQDNEKSTKVGSGVKDEETGSEAKGSAKKTGDGRSEGIVLQSSGRISKRPRKEYDPYSPPGRQVAPKKAVKTPEARKGRKHREVWTVEDKKNFFEAVKEHGRDWKGLYEYFRKHRKRGELERSQEHLRQLYYRMWHKIVKYISCPPTVDKQVVEIFGLICYGEMRKRIGSCMDESIGASLNEMVHKGTTFIRLKLKKTRKIKSFRVKTPQCTILKKLNSLEGLKHPKLQANPRITLPQEVTVELRSHSNGAWTRVQALSQNPRLRTRAHPSQRLSAILDFLTKKWQPHRVRVKEGMNEHDEPPRQELKLFPPPRSRLNPWDVIRFNRFKEAPRQPQLNLGLETYLQNLKNLGDCSPSGRKGQKRTVSRKTSINQDTGESSKVSVDGTDVSGDLKVKCESNSTNREQLRSIPEDNNPNNSDTTKIFSKFGLDSGNVTTNDGPEPSLWSISSPTPNDSAALQSDRPLPTLMSPTSSDSRVVINPLASLASPSTYDSTKDSHGTFNSLNSEPQDTRSELSSSPETGNSLLTKQSSSKMEGGESVFSGITALGEDLETEPANEEITGKIDMFREGLNRTKADQFTLADLYLMMGNPERIVLEYDWVDVVDTPNILDLSHVTNMLRRLIHLASSEFTDFNKPKLPPQLKRSEGREEGTASCTCGATTQQGTPPNTKSSRNMRARVRKDPGTPRGGGRGAKSGLEVGENTGQTPKETQASAEVPGMKRSLYPASSNLGNDPLLNPQDVFKVPAAVAPRGQVQGSQTSPITINNIAQKLSPNALLEHINKANSHTNMLVSARRRRNVRKPMIVQRKIMPKPTSLTTTGGATYILQPQPSVIRGPRPLGNVKVMHPADIKGLTVKSIIPESSVSTVREGQEMRIVPVSSQLNPSTATQGSVKTFSSVENVSLGGSQMTTVTTNSGQVPAVSLPVMFNGFVPISSSSPSLSLITQAAMATGISTEKQLTETNHAASTTDKGGGAASGVEMVARIPSPVLAEASNMSTGDLGSNLSSFLDISIPEPAGAGDTTERMIDLALANSSSSFSVSALLEGHGCEKTQDRLSKDPSLSCVRGASPANLSPGKPFKAAIHSLEDYDFSLSGFLAESPLKKPVSASHPVTASTATATILSTPSLTNDSSRDSVRFDVDIALQSMLNENSLDYVSKFADLANELAAATGHDDRLLPNSQKPH